MRIVQLIDSLDYGGAEQVVANLSTRQSLDGDSVRLVCLRTLGPQPVNVHPLIDAGVEIITLDKPPGFHLETLRRLIAYLKRERIEVIHTHNHMVHHYGAIAGRVAGTPVILNTLHGTSSLRMPLWSKALYWFSCLMGNAVVCVCQQVYDVFRKGFILPDGAVLVVDNGIDLSRFTAIRRDDAAGIAVCGTIGRLDPVKDHETLLKAFAMVTRKCPNAELRLLGDGAIRPELERLAESLSITDAVHFDGFSLDTARFLAGLGIYVISSRSEGLPLTLLEAMGAGLPVVSTAVGGVPEIVRGAGCGWLCAAEDSHALARVIEEAIQAPDLAMRGERGRRFAADHYSVERMSKDYGRVYQSIYSRSRGLAGARKLDSGLNESIGSGAIGRVARTSHEREEGSDAS